MKLFGVLVIMILIGVCQGGLFSWLFKRKKAEGEKQQAAAPSSNGHLGNPTEIKETAMIAKIPFEIKSSDERFLKQATELGAIKSSELDVCHHKVILTIQKSCAELNEEELSKVAVNLLNCQSSVENRDVFPCTGDMSLSDCTRNMDSNTWNAYHIISNRARAVCYASRQEQFGAKAQMAVNALMNTAEEQIKSMNDLQDGQKALGKATSDTLESLGQGHEHLKQQQQQLSTAHQHVHSYISVNLRELSREKKLIASGQRELALITESIKRKIEEAKKQLMTQEDSQRASHKLILQDLSKIHDDALKIWQKLDTSTHNILQTHEETVRQYGHLAADMQQMNATVHYLMDLLQSTKQEVEDQLSWITSLVGGTDNTVQKVYSCVLHACYFFFGMISASFLQVPYLTRVALVVLVPLNALAEIKHDTSLEFSTLTTVLALCILVNLVISCIWSAYSHHRKPECIQNGVLNQPVVCSSAKATHLSPIIQLVPEKYVEGTEEFDEYSTKRSGNSFLSSSVAGSAGDFSSDEEVSSVRPPSIFLRKRMFGSLCSRESEGTVGLHKEADSKEESESESIRAEKKEDVDTSVKTLSSVRRQLIDHLNTYPPRFFHHNMSVDGTETGSGSPVRETTLNQSNMSSRSLTPRKPCASICKNGQLCRNLVMGENLYCHRHGGGSQESTPWSRRGSRRNTPLRS